MTDKKISALTSSTTPLAGTEVLPIVQSGATVKVAVSDLTAGRSVAGLDFTTSNNGLSLTGRYNASYPSTGAGYFQLWTNNSDVQNGGMTLKTNLNGTLTDSFKFDEFGNILPSRAAKGINFTANTPAAGKTSQLLNWYEEGIWTPVFAFSGGATGITGTFEGAYTRVGRLVTLTANVTLTSKGSSTGNIIITGIPFSSGNYLPNTSFESSAGAGFYTNTVNVYGLNVIINTSELVLYGPVTSGASSMTQLTNANIADNFAMRFTLQYFA